MNNKYNQPMNKATEDHITQHGGFREGSGAPKIHPDEHKERVKKYRATQAEWDRFIELCPQNSREAFTTILNLLENNQPKP